MGYKDGLPLSGVRVLDATDELGAYGGRLLADLGADVVRLEPTGGLRSRSRAPFHQDIPGSERALGFLYTESNKRAVTLDVSSDASLAALMTLGAQADVILIAHSKARPVVGLDTEQPSLSWAPSEAIVVCVTPYGLTGPYRHWKATHLTSYAMSGLMIGQGPQDGPPSEIPGQQMYAHVGTHLAITVLTALRARDEVGGQFADLSAHEILASSNFGFYQYANGNIIGRRTQAQPSEHGGVFECADGLIEFQASTDKHWHGLVELLGNPSALSDPSLAHPGARYGQRDHVIRALKTEIAKISKEDFVHRGQELGVPCSPLNSIGDFVNDAQPRSRGFFVTAPLPDGDEVEMPGAPYRSTVPLQQLYARPAPRLGGLTVGDVLADWSGGNSRGRGARQLSEVRIVSFGTAIAGALTGTTLADLGADVIKIESPTRPDNLRRLAIGDEAATQEPSGAETSAMFANFNRSTRSLSLDMKNSVAVELCERILSAADVVIDNYAPGVMKRWGLGHEQLAELNPALIQVSLSGFGHTDGPRSHYLAYGATVCSFVGLTQTWGYGNPVHFDYVSQAHGVLAVLAALAMKDSTGRGTFVDLAEVEAAGAVMAPLILDYVSNERVLPPEHHPAFGSVWSRVLPCLGDDAWVAIELETLDDWRAFVAVLGREDLADSADAVARREADQGATEWASKLSPLQAARLLQSVGVAAAPVQNEEELYRDPQLRERGFIVNVPHPDLGALEFTGTPHRLNLTPPTITSGAPRLGEHSEDILRSWLNLSESEIDELAHGGAFWSPESARLRS